MSNELEKPSLGEIVPAVGGLLAVGAGGLFVLWLIFTIIPFWLVTGAVGLVGGGVIAWKAKPTKKVG